MLETTLKIKTNGSTTLVLSSMTKENFKQIVQKELEKIVDSVSENTEIFDVKIHFFSEYVNESVSINLK